MRAARRLSWHSTETHVPSRISGIKTLSLSLIAAAFALTQASSAGLAIAAERSRADVAADHFTVIVMDPLALPLSCPCVKGYAQRDYEQLGKFLEGRLKRPVRVVFSETVRDALEKKSGGR